ncbi:hypothetical protein OTU49_004292 [Cherax quadricarinatus]
MDVKEEPTFHTHSSTSHSMSGRASLAESLASWEYDEVTDISEESQPLQQASYHSLVQGERAISTHHLKVSEQISGRGSTFVEHSSKEILSHSSNTSLPQKKDLGELGGMTGPGQPKPLAHPPGMPGRGDDDEEDEDEDDDDDDGQAPPPEG